MDLRDPADVKTLRFGLGPGRPVLARRARHGRSPAVLYDMHFELELGVVLAGRMERVCPGWKAVLGPGEVWLCGVWEPHGFRVPRASCEALVLVISTPWLAAMRFEEAPGFDPMRPFAAAPRDRPRVRPAARGPMAEAAAALAAAIDRSGPFAALRLRLGLIDILLRLQESWQAPASSAPCAAEDFQRVRRAVEMALAGRQGITAAEAARACGMSRNRFSERFGRIMGMGFPEFARRARVSGAARQLVSTDAPLKAIARDWGFTDASHFLRCFARHYGCPPGEYRRRFTPRAAER